MSGSGKDLAKKIGMMKKVGIVAGPLLLLFAAMHFFLPDLRRSYDQYQVGLPVHRSGNVEVYAENEELARLIMEEFQRFRSAFSRIFGDRLPLDDLPKTRITLFPSEESFQNYYRKKWQENLPNNSGYYDPSDGVIAVIDQGNPERIRRSIRHEAVHLFMNSGASAAKPRWSAWLNEGLATVFEHVEYKNGESQIGNLSPANFNAIPRTEAEKESWIPLPRLLEVSEKAFRRSGNRQVYYESGLLVYYLLSRYSERFWKYFRYEKSSNGGGKKAFERIIGIPLDRIDEELIRWYQKATVTGPLFRVKWSGGK